MKADSLANPVAGVYDDKLHVKGGFTKREDLLKSLLCALVSTLEPAHAQNLQPKNAKALMDSAENLASAFMHHLSAADGLQYETILHRIEQLERSVPFAGEPNK